MTKGRPKTRLATIVCKRCGETKPPKRKDYCETCSTALWRAVRPPKPAKPRPIRLCQHCHEKQRNRPRGLCWACFGNPYIRDLYEPRPKTATPAIKRRGPAPQPTNAPVNSEERLEVYRQRAELGYDIFHPGDSMERVQEGARKKQRA